MKSHTNFLHVVFTAFVHFHYKYVLVLCEEEEEI